MTKSFKIDIYDTIITVVILNTKEEGDRYIKKYNKKNKTNYEEGGFEGCVLEKNNREFTIILMSSYLSINTLTHECFHVQDAISDHNGLSEEGNKEDRAYLNGYINEKVFKIVEQYKKLNSL